MNHQNTAQQTEKKKNIEYFIKYTQLLENLMFMVIITVEFQGKFKYNFNKIVQDMVLEYRDRITQFRSIPRFNLPNPFCQIKNKSFTIKQSELYALLKINNL